MIDPKALQRIERRRAERAQAAYRRWARHVHWLDLATAEPPCEPDVIQNIETLVDRSWQEFVWEAQ